MKRDQTVPKEFKSWRLKLHNKQTNKQIYVLNFVADKKSKFNTDNHFFKLIICNYF